MSKLVWLLVLSPTIFMALASASGIIPLRGLSGYFVVYVMLQGMFLLAAFERRRRSARLKEGEKVAMPKWQKVVLVIFLAYVVLLFFIGSLTRQ